MQDALLSFEKGEDATFPSSVVCVTINQTQASRKVTVPFFKLL